MALKVDLMEITRKRSRNYKQDALESSNFPPNKGKSPQKGNQPQPRAVSSQQIENRETSGDTRVRQPVRNPNLYARATLIKCYKCGQLGHRSNERGRRR